AWRTSQARMRILCGTAVRKTPDMARLRGAGLSIEDPRVERVANQIGAPMQAQLRCQARKVRFDGLDAQRESVGDLLMRVSPRHQREDLVLPAAEQLTRVAAPCLRDTRELPSLAHHADGG